MSLSEIVNVTITTTNPGVTQAGFGVPLIATPSPSWTEHTREYSDLTGVVADFAATTPEYLAAQAMFAQSPTLPKIKIGRMNTAPTQVHVITVISVVNSQLYEVNVFYAGVLQKASFTSDGSATNDEIVDGLVAAINALAAPDVGATATATGSSGSHVVTLTADATKTWRAVEPLNSTSPTLVPALLSVAETTADPSTLTTSDLDAIVADSDDWYGLVLLYKSSAILLAAAGWIETKKKLLITASADTKIATEAVSTAEDVFEELLDASRARTAPFYHPRLYEFPDAAEVARFFPIDPGGDNWRLKTLSGVTPQTYTSTQTTNMKAKRANFYYTLGGVNVVGGDGKVSDNEYIDVIRFLDWYEARLSERIVNRLLSANKIPYTDAGIAVIEGEVRAQNKEGIDAGGISPDPAPTVTVPKAASVSGADKTARLLKNVNTTWTLAGAINSLKVNVQVNA